MRPKMLPLSGVKLAHSAGAVAPTTATLCTAISSSTCSNISHTGLLLHSLLCRMSTVKNCAGRPSDTTLLPAQPHDVQHHHSPPLNYIQTQMKPSHPQLHNRQPCSQGKPMQRHMPVPFAKHTIAQHGPVRPRSPQLDTPPGCCCSTITSSLVCSVIHLLLLLLLPAPKSPMPCLSLLLLLLPAQKRPMPSFSYVVRLLLLLPLAQKRPMPFLSLRLRWKAMPRMPSGSSTNPSFLYRPTTCGSA